MVSLSLVSLYQGVGKCLEKPKADQSGDGGVRCGDMRKNDRIDGEKCEKVTKTLTKYYRCGYIVI